MSTIINAALDVVFVSGFSISFYQPHSVRDRTRVIESCFGFLLTIYTIYRFPILKSFLNQHPLSILNASFFMRGGGTLNIKGKHSYYHNHLSFSLNKTVKLYPENG